MNPTVLLAARRSRFLPPVRTLPQVAEIKMPLAGALMTRWICSHLAYSMLAALAWCVTPWPAQATPPTAIPRDAASWLMRIHEAAYRRNYQGTLTVSSAGTVSSSRVAHYCEGGQQYEQIEALDGEPRSVLRHNELVHTLWPRNRLALVEQRDPRVGFPALPADASRRVLESYELLPLGQDRIAGHEADVLLLKARDKARFSQRLWVEQRTGLLLRSDILADNGTVLESSAFSELRLDVRPRSDQLMNALRRVDGFRVVRPALVPTTLDTEGWQLKTLPTGFREVSCARRDLDPLAGNHTPVVLQLIHSDGLTHVSMFIEPFVPQRHAHETSLVTGATHTLMLRRDDHWVTVVGDVPPDTLKRFANALERRR